MICLNLGSGQRKFQAPFINVDVNPKWEPDVVADAANLHMFHDGYVDLVVAHQLIEHVGLGEFDGVIQEVHRILKKGGSFIVTTPNLRELVKAWAMGRIDDYIFCVNLYGAYMDNEADRHRWLYYEKTLREALKRAAPWDAVAPFDWRPLPGADMAKDWWVLSCEAIK